jgi:hypothetical protein
MNHVCALNPRSLDEQPAPTNLLTVEGETQLQQTWPLSKLRPTNLPPNQDAPEDAPEQDGDDEEEEEEGGPPQSVHKPVSKKWRRSDKKKKRNPPRVKQSQPTTDGGVFMPTVPLPDFQVRQLGSGSLIVI